MTVIRNRAALAAAVAVLALPAAPAQGQTAYDVNRLNQAVQICNSPMGAGTPECAQLRAKMGGGGVPGIGGLGGFGGGGKAAGIAGLLGAAMTAARSQQAAAPPPTANPGAVQQAIAACVQNAGGNNAAIQACLQIASTPPAAAYRSQQMLPSDRRAQDGAMATYAAGQSYQACVAANPGNWQACLQTMNNNTQAGLLNAGVSPQELQAAGGYVPPGYAPPASNPFGALLPKR